MAFTTQVDSVAMQTARGHFEHHLSVQIANKNSIQDELAALRAAYTGDTSGQLQVALNGWVAAFDNILNQLDTMVEALGGNRDMYIRSDEQNQQAAGQLQRTVAALPGL